MCYRFVKVKNSLGSFLWPSQTSLTVYPPPQKKKKNINLNEDGNGPTYDYAKFADNYYENIVDFLHFI